MFTMFLSLAVHALLNMQQLSSHVILIRTALESLKVKNAEILN